MGRSTKVRAPKHAPKALSSLSHASRASKKGRKRVCKARDEASRLELDARLHQVRTSQPIAKQRSPLPARTSRASHLSQTLKEFENLST